MGAREGSYVLMNKGKLVGGICATIVVIVALIYHQPAVAVLGGLGALLLFGDA